MPESSPVLEQLVSALAEVYQPIYGHDNLSQQASRPCKDRLETIRNVHDALRQKLGRPVRVLDIGCAQGFFSLSLAACGAEVTGVDFDAPNVTVCCALAKENPALSVTFHVKSAETAIQEAENGTYDLVLGLSVFHHMVHGKGFAFVQDLLTTLATKAGACLFEMAQSNEPPSWAASQPERVEDLLSGFAFCHLLQMYPTHLSQIERPFFFASNHFAYWGRGLYPFTKWFKASHQHVPQDYTRVRRFYFNDTQMLKSFRLDGPMAESNVYELSQENAILTSLAEKQLPFPRVIETGSSETAQWLVRDVIPGKLLISAMMDNDPYNDFIVVADILDQLVLLEKHGLFHDDVRTWNVVIAPDRHAHLIDYGAISNKQADCNWPWNLYLSFLSFVAEVSSHTTTPTQAPPPYISPVAQRGFHKIWISAFWETPPETWSFQLMQEKFNFARNNKDRTQPPVSALSVWMAAVEHYLASLQDHVKHPPRPPI